MSRNLMRMALMMAATAAYAQDDIFGCSSPRLDAPSGNIPSDKQKCQPKAQDKVSCSRCNVCWIASIIPEQSRRGYTGEIEVRINPAKKDGTRSNREFVLCSMEIDSIKKIS